MCIIFYMYTSITVELMCYSKIQPSKEIQKAVTYCTYTAVCFFIVLDEILKLCYRIQDACFFL